MDILRGIKTISVVLVSFFATLFVFLFILKSGIGEISFHSYILHTLILSISSIIAFYGSYLYYKTYAEKRNVRDFLFALSFFTFGTSFFLHALSVSDFFLFSETIFDITEHYGLFLSAIFLFISVFFHKVDVPKVYAFKAEISFVIVLAFFGIFIFFVYISDLAA
ncbi:hypothetical protein HY249_02420, partial [Candidatus Azambacteria bacterium]|nr:hypothetical protein [Candidatus Azambacteria bacterium]